MPSGDQAGSASEPACVTIECRPVPVASTTQRSRPLVALARSKTMRVPSGDQLGCRAETPGGVSARAPLPSAAIVQSVYSPPSVWRTNAMRVPSGEYAGSASAWGSLVSVTGADPSAAMLTISSLPDAAETTASRPFRPAGRARAGPHHERPQRRQSRSACEARRSSRGRVCRTRSRAERVYPYVRCSRGMPTIPASGRM